MGGGSVAQLVVLVLLVMLLLLVMLVLVLVLVMLLLKLLVTSQCRRVRYVETPVRLHFLELIVIGMALSRQFR